jgi:phosphomannomutase
VIFLGPDSLFVETHTGKQHPNHKMRKERESILAEEQGKHIYTPGWPVTLAIALAQLSADEFC